MLEKKVRQILQYVGLIGAILMAFVYVITVLVLIQGFHTSIDLRNTILFAIVNALVGMIIMQFLKVQGISYAKMLPENAEILRRYYNTKTKDKKPHSITWFWWTTVIKDLLVKALSFAASTFGIIYLVIQGSHDYHLLLLAFSNLIMFVCFGLLSMNNAYEFYNDQHIPYIKEQLKELTNND